VLSENPQTNTATAAAKTQTILRNSFWYGLETALNLVASLVGTVLVARILGPERIAYYSYLYWLILTSGTLGSVGLPSTTRKYMAEYLGRGEPGVARALYAHNLRLQCWVSGAVVACALFMAIFFALPGYKAIACVLVLSMLPRMAGFIPSMANNASENMFANVPGAAVGTVVTLLSVALSLALGWDLVGLAAGVLIANTVECALKLHSAWRTLRSHPVTPLSPDLKARMGRFSRQNLVLMLLNLVVWDRSDLILLRMLGKHLVDVTFFSICFSLTDRLLLMPQVLQGAIGITLMVEHGRNPVSAGRMVEAASRYALLMGLPLMVGLSALSPVLVVAIYGTRYSPMVPLLALMALFAIPKALLPPAQTFLGATEQQGFLVGWFLCCGAVNLAGDALLIPHFGAIGAAWGNGTAQSLAALGVWAFTVHRFRLQLPYRQLARITASGLLMGIGVAFLAHSLPPWPGVLTGLAAGIVIFPAALWASHGLVEEDFHRLAPLSKRMPRSLVPSFIWMLSLLTRFSPAATSSE